MAADWSIVPDIVLLKIFTGLDRTDRASCARTCKAWNTVFYNPQLWQNFTFYFYMPAQEKYLSCLDVIGKFLKSVYIELDQEVQGNRVNACKIITGLASLDDRRLESIKVKFMGENPYFYAGKEFIDSFSVLFGPPPGGEEGSYSLRDVDLSGLSITLDETLIDLLAENHPKLQTLNIQNDVYVCKIHPNSILKLVQRCRTLHDLRLYSSSLSEDILLALKDGDREPLQHLSLFCRFEEKYCEAINGTTWQTIVDKLPNLKVTLGFDHTIAPQQLTAIMKPQIPVYVLRFETFSDIHPEVRIATQYYKESLQKLILQTPPQKYNQQELDKALVELAQQCKHLRSMHVFCLLSQETVESILELCPEMKERNSYTLKYEMEPHPWCTGTDCFDD